MTHDSLLSHRSTLNYYYIIKLSISAINIKAFQPEVVPLRSITTLTIATADQLNASSSIQCRFNDISTAANLKGNLVFCNTPPMRSTDKVALHLEVDGKLHKAKKPLRFHGEFTDQEE